MAANTIGIWADAVALVHVAFAAFVLVGFGLIVVGRRRGWAWVRNPYFRVMHLLAVGQMVAKAWFDVRCPLTMLENRLRSQAAAAGEHSLDAVAVWSHRLIFYGISNRQFTAAATVLAALVAVQLVLTYRDIVKSWGTRAGGDAEAVGQA
jgi:hypothetical protein